MNLEKSIKKDLYYTKDHEWVNFQGAVAYTGVSSFKLVGFKEIHQVIFNGQSGLRKGEDLIATIKYTKYFYD